MNDQPLDQPIADLEFNIKNLPENPKKQALVDAQRQLFLAWAAYRAERITKDP